MCERTSAMFAIRACRVFCMKNFQAYPDQCGVPGKRVIIFFAPPLLLIQELLEQWLKWQIKWEKWSQLNTARTNMTKPFKNVWKCCHKFYIIKSYDYHHVTVPVRSTPILIYFPLCNQTRNKCFFVLQSPMMCLQRLQAVSKVMLN